MYYLFLDDSRKPSNVNWVALPENVEWVICKTYYEFVETIRARGIPKFITYDCDLCDEHYQAFFNLKHTYPIHYKEFKTKCGIDCAEFLIAFCKKQDISHPPFVVHSQNQFGGGYIENIIKKSLTKSQV